MADAGPPSGHRTWTLGTPGTTPSLSGSQPGPGTISPPYTAALHRRGSGLARSTRGGCPHRWKDTPLAVAADPYSVAFRARRHCGAPRQPRPSGPTASRGLDTRGGLYQACPEGAPLLCLGTRDQCMQSWRRGGGNSRPLSGQRRLLRHHLSHAHGSRADGAYTPRHARGEPTRQTDVPPGSPADGAGTGRAI